jgi:excisionase family DNA binding protein
MTKNKILTINDVKDYLQVSKSTVYELISSGKLQAIKIRSCYRVTKEDLKKFVKQNKTF